MKVIWHVLYKCQYSTQPTYIWTYLWFNKTSTANFLSWWLGCSFNGEMTWSSTLAVRSKMPCSKGSFTLIINTSPSFPGDPVSKTPSSLSYPWQKKAVSFLPTSIINISVQRLTAQAWFIFTHVHIWIGSLSKTIITVPPGFQPHLPPERRLLSRLLGWFSGVRVSTSVPD